MSKQWLFIWMVVGILLLSTCAQAEEKNCRFQLALGVHSKSLDGPEYEGSNPLGKILVGCQHNIVDTTYFLWYYDHISSIPDWEKGHGQNTLWGGIEYKF